MDNLPQPHYSANVINQSGQSYPGQRQLQPQSQPSGPLSQTLPPLQPNHQTMSNQNSYQTYGQSPRTSGTPAPAGNVSNYAPPQQNPAARGGYGMMSNSNSNSNNSPYAPPPPPYSSSMMSQATPASSAPQPIAPAPAQSSARPPVLRPMPQEGVMPAMNSPYAQSSMMLPEQPTHVVGSQGRRGILPSAPGMPIATGNGGVKAPIPQKDADGKFPCPHCTKTYLHAKHLKRHLLRHTGDRPYMCVLCRDTFSRSDILKRHFIKCSVRRGNPTGASHLSHPQAHVKKVGQGKAMGNEGEANMNGMAGVPGDQIVPTYGLIPASDGMSNVANEQNQLPRSGNVNSRLDEASRDRRSMSGSVMAAPSRQGPYEGAYNSADVPTSVPPPQMSHQVNPQMASYNVSQHQMFGGSNSADWSQMFQAGAQNTHVSSHPPASPNHGHLQTAFKAEPNVDTGRPTGLGMQIQRVTKQQPPSP